VLTIAQALDVLLRHQRIDAALAKTVTDFIAAAQVPPTAAVSALSSSSSAPATESAPAVSETAAADTAAAAAAAASTDLASAPHQSYEARAALCSNALTARLFRIMEAKRTNLCVALDVTAAARLLELADAIGPHICVLKTHADVLADFEYDTFVPRLRALADKHNFLIFEDRKFADIGNTVQLQFASGVHRIADWAHVVNAHALPGAGIVRGLAAVGQPKGCGLLLLAEMSSAGSLFTPEYTRATVAMAAAHADFVVGFIAQRRLTTAPGLVHMTPGVQGGIGADGGAAGAPRGGGMQSVAARAHHQRIFPNHHAMFTIHISSSISRYLSPCLPDKTWKSTSLDFSLTLCLRVHCPSDPHHCPTRHSPPPLLADAKGDALGQQYNTPARVIGACGTDIIIVGRGVYEAADPAAAARAYQHAGWQAYLARMQ
jgi:orotidine 5'-phosphate decarboxylase subfamily 1